MNTLSSVSKKPGAVHVLLETRSLCDYTSAPPESTEGGPSARLTCR